MKLRLSKRVENSTSDFFATSSDIFSFKLVHSGAVIFGKKKKKKKRSALQVSVGSAAIKKTHRPNLCKIYTK